jgi:IS30 family transposase
MTRSYRHLTYEQSCQISLLNKRGESQSEIARALNIDRSTICREISRNREEQFYNCREANLKAIRRRRNCTYKKMTSDLISTIEKSLKLGWSPEQITGRLKKEGKSHVSHETIYRYVWADKKTGGSLHKLLRHRGKKYNKRSSKHAGRGCIPYRIDISERPLIVEAKVRVGDWELDTIVGRRQSRAAIVSMVDRATKLTKLRKVNRKTEKNVREALVKTLSPIKDCVLTMTSDNGCEFAGHWIVSRELETSFFFATPYHSWERGLNEHTNGLVRQYLPKGTNFDEIPDSEIEKIETYLNTRPRKSLGFETPLEAFHRLTYERQPFL